ncbi:MAG: phosphopantetheine-binding protein [Myxococcota bacterium]
MDVRAGQLVAWVVADRDEAAIRSALAAQLPASLVPQRVVAVDALPRGASGKVDRARLPDPGVTAADYVAPASDIEQALADIWGEVLRVPRVGTRDDFFALGGHSLLLPEVALRLRERLGVEVPVRTLLQEPQIAELALSVEEALLDQLEGGEQ